MAVLLEQVMPEGVDAAMLDEVASEMNVVSDPPSGLVVHVHLMQDGRLKVVDVWESQAQYETFRTSRLLPAMGKVAQNRGLAMAGEPQTTITEVDGVVRGPASLLHAVSAQSKILVGRLSQEVNKRRGATTS